MLRLALISALALTLSACATVDAVQPIQAETSRVAHIPQRTSPQLALRDLPAGTIIRKYGEAIGALTEAVGRGGHVHVHNLRSRRARGGG